MNAPVETDRAEPFELPELKAERPIMRNEVRLTPLLTDCLDQLVEWRAAKTGEAPRDVRRWVELTALQYGIEKLQEELRP